MKKLTWMRILVLLFSVALVAPAWSQGDSAAEPLRENPSALAMTGDLLLVRPVMMVGTLLSTVVWALSTPFSIPGGNFKQATDTLVIKPAMATFVRCLGCTKSGYKRDE